MKEEQELGIGSKAQESRSLCDAFHLFRDHTECFFLLFGTRRKESGDVWRPIEGSELGFDFDIYICLYH